MNEAETRAELIDPALEAAGWGVVDGSRGCAARSDFAGAIAGGGQAGQAGSAAITLFVGATAWMKA